MSKNTSRSVKSLDWLSIRALSLSDQDDPLAETVTVTSEDSDASQKLATHFLVEGLQVRDLAFGETRVHLSRRERDCLHWAAVGRSTKEIADALALSDNTVNEYFASAQRKLKASNRVQAVMRAYVIDLISA